MVTLLPLLKDCYSRLVAELDNGVYANKTKYERQLKEAAAKATASLDRLATKHGFDKGDSLTSFSVKDINRIWGKVAKHLASCRNHVNKLKEKQRQLENQAEERRRAIRESQAATTIFC